MEDNENWLIGDNVITNGVDEISFYDNRAFPFYVTHKYGVICGFNGNSHSIPVEGKENLAYQKVVHLVQISNKSIEDCFPEIDLSNCESKREKAKLCASVIIDDIYCDGRCFDLSNEYGCTVFMFWDKIEDDAKSKAIDEILDEKELNGPTVVAKPMKDNEEDNDQDALDILHQIHNPEFTPQDKEDRLSFEKRKREQTDAFRHNRDEKNQTEKWDTDPSHLEAGYRFHNSMDENRIIERKKHKKVKSAMSQVHNKVNAGIMDGITCGGMFESNKTIFVSPEQINEIKTMLLESTDFSKGDYKKYFKQIGDYMSSHGLNVKPFPKVKLDDTKQDGLFIMTGHYEPDNKLVVLYTDGRHPKDILRTFSHEMIHHHQNLSGKNLTFTGADNVKDNKELEKLEAEAYLKGNIYFRKWTEYFKNNGKESLNESKLLSELNACDVDLSSFELKKELNPKFWIDGHLDKRVRLKLLDLADDFMKEINLDESDVDDIVMTGSMANFNWDKKYSDIDLHIIVDYSDINKDTDLVTDYFKTKKDEWSLRHGSLKIYGFPVELFVQDKNTKHVSSGIYSLDKDKWIDEPKEKTFEDYKVDKGKVKKTAAKLATEVDKLCDEFKTIHGDKHKAEVLNKKAIEVFDKIKKQRKENLNNTGIEVCEGNLVFKYLRRKNYIQKIVDLREKTYNIMNSLTVK